MIRCKSLEVIYSSSFTDQTCKSLLWKNRLCAEKAHSLNNNMIYTSQANECSASSFNAIAQCPTTGFQYPQDAVPQANELQARHGA